MTREEVALFIEQLADRLAAGDRSFDLQMLIQPIDEALTGSVELMRKYEAESMFITRLSQLLLARNRPAGGLRNDPNDIIAQEVASLAPLDPAADRAALRALATRWRAEG